MSVVPADAIITSATATCSSGFRVDYFIYGGTPPYHVTSTFPDAVTLVNSTVAASGGSFEAVTNGQCVDPLVFSIVDAAGLQTTATLHNKPTAGGGGSTTPPAPIVVTPPSVTVAGGRKLYGQDVPVHHHGRNGAVQRGVHWRHDPSESGEHVARIVQCQRIERWQRCAYDLHRDASTPQLTTTATITCNP